MRCRLVDELRAMRLCAWRIKLGYGATGVHARNAPAACTTEPAYLPNATEPVRWCGKDSRTW